MAKVKTTRKWIADNYNCCAIGYCDIQTLLDFQTPDYYTCGVYGWNFDCYTFGNYAVTTGYRGTIDNCKNNYSYSMAEKYEKQAREIRKNWDLSYEQQREKINSLLADFLKEVFNHDFSGNIY